MKNNKGAASGPPKCECVKVAIRVRPMNSHEIEKKSKICVEMDTANNTVSVTSDKNQAKTFQFDYVYPMDTSQRDVYDQTAFPIVDSIFQGYNGTVFAYGQTGCGKTYTMMGIVNDPEKRGIIPNAFNHIFGYVKTEGESKRFLIRCSFVEIYNEEVRDLLGNCNQKLDIREDPKKGTFVKDLTYELLKDTKDIEKCLDKGNKNRHVGQTSMNDQSSRSHSLFTVYLEIEEQIDERNKKIKSGKLNLVDLAGSERVGKTNATGQTFDEGKKINLSLTALGSVIDALSYNRKHIPYKDSKLTRLLADSLGGNTKTVMFANISPASYNYEETVGTLRYASRAKLIKNAPKINEDPKDALLRKYEEEIKALKEQLALGTGGGGVQKSIGEKAGKGEDKYNDFVEDGLEEEEDDPEKQALLAKIAELERDLVGGQNLGTKNSLAESINKLKSCSNDAEREELNKRLQEEEEEARKFKEYREQQIKKNEEMEDKLKKLEEDKKKEEELLKNDAEKLQKKIKELTSEIDDIKISNAKDRTDYMESVKGIYRDNQLYREIIRYMLTDVELSQIAELSKYIEEDDKWTVRPFRIQDKKLSLPGMPMMGGMRNNNNMSNNRNNKNNRNFIFQNYREEEDEELNDYNNLNNYHEDNNNYNENDFQEEENNDYNATNKKFDTIKKEEIINTPDHPKNRKRIKIKLKLGDDSESIKKPEKDFDDKINGRMNIIQPREKININCMLKLNSEGCASPTNEPNDNNGTPNIKFNLMNKKEREKFEELTNVAKTNPNVNLAHIDPLSALQALKKGNGGKVILSPLSSLSIKTNNINMTNNINVKSLPIVLSNKSKGKLVPIDENNNNYY